MEPLIHFTVPFLVLVLLGLNLKKASLLALLALIPDFDALFLVHRSFSHSLVVLTALFLPLFAIAHALRRGMRIFALAFFSLASHIALDVFSGATPVFWPFYGNALWVKADLAIHLGSSMGLDPDLAIVAEPVDFRVLQSFDAPLFTGEGLMVSSILLVAAFMSLVRGWGVSEAMRSSVAMGMDGGVGGSVMRGSSVTGYGDILPDHVTVVIPTLNEAGAIGVVIDELRGEGYNNILVVDGYSQDGIAMSKGVRVIYQHSSGKTGALKTAVEHVTTPYILVMDGDHTYDPRDIKRLLIHGKLYSLVIGARDMRNMSRLHRLGNWVITKAFNMLFGTNLSDVCSGMYLIKTDFAKHIELATRGFSTEVEIAAQAAMERSITEVPIKYRPRIGKSKLSTWRHGLAILLSLIELARKHNPIL
ncbi:MAG: glycosyltransferase, partial [Sulfolobales archaeon]